MGEIKMPQLGETVVEGTITRWLKQEGDQIEADELLVEISTDKVDSEVPSSESGVIQKILVPEGETVKVGTPLAVIGEGGEAASDDSKSEDQAGDQDEGEQAEAKSGEAEAEEESDKAAAKGGREPEAGSASEGDEKKQPPPPPEKKESDEKPAAEAEKAKAGTGAGATGRPGDQSKRGIISPLVRRLADEHSVDLDDVEGTGTGGRIRKQDVLRFVEERKARPAAKPAASAEPAPEHEPERAPEREEAPAAASAAGEREELVPWTNIRRRTAEHMVAAHLESARAWNAVEADWTQIVRLRGSVKDAFKKREGFNLTYMPFLAKAVCDTLLEMPEVNASFDEENQANRVKHYVNLGVAVALEGGGLIVPVVKGADERNLVGVARGINDIVTKTRSKKLSPDDLQGGTFTITNPGPFGTFLTLPIINQPQVAILSTDAVQKRPSVVATPDGEDVIAVRHTGMLALTWDHRAFDGAYAAAFLRALKERLETRDWAAELD